MNVIPASSPQDAETESLVNRIREDVVPEELNARLDEQIPRGGPCGLAIDCELVEERFADTFAKWALNGAVAEIGAGYGIAMPPSLEDWGAPLADLSYELPES